MPLYAGTGRGSLRAVWLEAWRKHLARLALEPLEAQLAELIELHPEYHAVLEADPDAGERDWTPEQGRTNPYPAHGAACRGPRRRGEEVRDLGGIAGAVKSPGTHEQTHVFTKSRRAQTIEDDESWVEGGVTPTLNSFDVGDVRATTLIAGGEQSYHQRDRIYANLAPALDAYGDTPSDTPMVAGALGVPGDDDPLLPPGLDSHRYRCCGNGVVSSVAEWVGRRLIEVLDA